MSNPERNDTPSEIWDEWKETGRKMLDSIELDPEI